MPMSKRFRRSAALPVLLLALLLFAVAGLPPAPALAACGSPTVVNTTAQLNDAIDVYNNIAAACDFEIELGGDITLTADVETIYNNIVDVNLLVDGNGFTLDGNHEFATFFAFQSDTTFDNITITGSKTKGIDVQEGTLRVSRSTIRDNEVHGIEAYATDVVVVESTLAGNLYNGINFFEENSTLTAINTTVAGNGATGVIVVDGAAEFTHVTIANNDGGVYISFGSAIIDNSILAGNGLEDCASLASTIDVNFSLVQSDSSFSPCGVSDGVDGNLVGQAADLGPLADNGGPTLTHRPAADSPAVDAGSDTLAVDENGDPLPTDQRGAGFPRLAGLYVDMGAVEAGEAAIYVSPIMAGVTAGGLDFDSDDILMWDGTDWSTWFDGSAHGLLVEKAVHNINAFWIEDEAAGSVIMAFAQNARKVPGITPKVDGMDLVRWDGSAFSLWFDGSDVGLTVKTSEKIDGLHVLPGSESPIGGNSCLAYLLISTKGAGKVPNFAGGALSFRGEDVLGFCMTNSGLSTAGFWHMVFDGSEQGLPINATDSISVSDDGGTMYLTTSKAINISGEISGGPSMVFAYDFGSQTFSGPHFIAADAGLPKQVDGLHVTADLDR